MILIVCPTCCCALRVTGDLEEAHFLVGQKSDLWPDKFECFRCAGKATGVMELAFTSKVQMDLVEVSPQEALMAATGYGLPAERVCDKLTLNELLQGQTVKHVAGKDIIGSNRIVVDFLELADGSRVYLGSSNEGAVIYKITRPHSYAEAVR